MPTELDDQQRVLSEASHDLANRFHRSYYFLELLDDAIGPDHEVATPLLARLRETVEETETIAKRALQFVRPIELRLLKVRVDDLVASLRQHVGLRALEVGGDAGAGKAEVAVDPTRISEALSLLCRAGIDEADANAPVRIELLAGDPVGLRVRRPAGGSLPGAGDLALALTARIARLHGGELRHDEPDGEAASLTLLLPFAGKGD